MGSYKKLWIVSNEILKLNENIVLDDYIDENKLKKVLKMKEVFNFWKDTPDFTGDTNNLFKDSITISNAIDIMPTLITKIQLEEIIKNKQNDIRDYYKMLWETYKAIKENITELKEWWDFIKDFFDRKVGEWSWWEDYEVMICGRVIKLPTENPIDLSDENKLTKSTLYEYSLFELVRILKTTDFKNNSIVLRWN